MEFIVGLLATVLVDENYTAYSFDDAYYALEAHPLSIMQRIYVPNVRLEDHRDLAILFPRSLGQQTRPIKMIVGTIERVSATHVVTTILHH